MLSRSRGFQLGLAARFARDARSGIGSLVPRLYMSLSYVLHIIYLSSAVLQEPAH